MSSFAVWEFVPFRDDHGRAGLVAPAHAAGPEIVAGPRRSRSASCPGRTRPSFSSVRRKAGPFRIALANGYIANTWRIQMIQTAKAYAAQPDVAAKLKEFKVVSTGEDVAAQIAAVNNFIDSGFDAIVVNAQNPTAFKPGDQARQGSRRGAGGLRQHSRHRGRDQRRRRPEGPRRLLGEMADRAMFRTAARSSKCAASPAHRSTPTATTASTRRSTKSGKKWNVVEVYGKWDDPTAQKVTADAIAVQKHFDGFTAQGGDTGVVQAMLDAKQPIVPFGGETENGFRKFCAKIRATGPDVLLGRHRPGAGRRRDQDGDRGARGQVVPQSVKLPLATAEDPNFKDGENYYPDQSDNFFVGNSFPTCSINFSARGDHGTVEGEQVDDMASHTAAARRSRRQRATPRIG